MWTSRKHPFVRITLVELTFPKAWTESVPLWRRLCLLPFCFFQKRSLRAKKLVLNKYEICLKMLEMAILETQVARPSKKARAFGTCFAPLPPLFLFCEPGECDSCFDCPNCSNFLPTCLNDLTTEINRNNDYGNENLANLIAMTT